MNRMDCADIEILLAEYVDGSLRRDAKAAVKDHLENCPACRELAEDAAAAVGFMERAAVVDAPPELVTRILFEVSSGQGRALVKPPLARRLFGKLFGGWLEPILQPRMAMGMAMTALFLGMVVHGRQLTAADLDPVKMWTSAETRVNRVWDRGVKYYENMRLVFEIQSRLDEWASEVPDSSNPPERDSQ
jgi:anti-sigma factor RsiW